MNDYSQYSKLKTEGLSATILELCLEDRCVQHVVKLSERRAKNPFPITLYGSQHVNYYMNNLTGVMFYHKRPRIS